MFLTNCPERDQIKSDFSTVGDGSFSEVLHAKIEFQNKFINVCNYQIKIILTDNYEQLSIW